MKKGSLVKNIVEVKPQYDFQDQIQPGTIGRVLKVERKSNTYRVAFKGKHGEVCTRVQPSQVVEFEGPKIMPKVGDLFVETYGYEQTNIVYHQVVEIKKGSVVVREIVGKEVYDQAMAGQSHPMKDQFCGEPKLHRLFFNTDGSPSFKTTSYSRAYPTEWNKSHFFSCWH